MIDYFMTLLIGNEKTIYDDETDTCCYTSETNLI